MNLGQAGLRAFVKKRDLQRQRIIDLQRQIMGIKDKNEMEPNAYYDSEIFAKEREIALMKEKVVVLENECKAIKEDIEARIERGKRKIKLELDEFKAAEEYIKTLNI